MLPQWIIRKKRDGYSLTKEEIDSFIKRFAVGDIPDYQMAALAMAIYFRGMTPEEISYLTKSMINSGGFIDTSGIPLPKIDKHSTGGIGDKVSHVLVPLIACCGIADPMLTGRGLGITGGTLDKLEAIPGFRADLSEEEFLAITKRCGCCITGQTSRIAPADKKMYAMRDLTATIDSIALITASIMSKKLAVGLDGLVLDVKYGAGAFMQTLDEARQLAQSMVAVGNQMGTPVAALITTMNTPLGHSVGNTLEIIETIETLQGNGPQDLMELTLALGSQMLLLGKVVDDEADAERLLLQQIQSGNAFEKFKTMVALQGGDASYLDQPDKFPKARIQKPILAKEAGTMAAVNAKPIGQASLLLGAGRQKITDTIDYAVGISQLKKPGDPIEKGETMALLHAQDESTLQEAEKILATAFTIADHPIITPSRITEKITKETISE